MAAFKLHTSWVFLIHPPQKILFNISEINLPTSPLLLQLFLKVSFTATTYEDKCTHKPLRILKLELNLLGEGYIILSSKHNQNDNNQIKRYFHKPRIRIQTWGYPWYFKILQINFVWAGSKPPWHPEQSFLQAGQIY